MVSQAMDNIALGLLLALDGERKVRLSGGITPISGLLRCRAMPRRVEQLS